ncbi:MAG: threo-3-hydroxy-L-aspartate ammonia-lyase [Fimbriimonadaceae bacterium]|nr:threo-3-hydroxy-L-aspartate ammonia-lyase [Fimbriimonadaceae bacterium]
MVSLADVEAARGRLRGVAHVTPVVTSRTLDARAGASVFCKMECFQRGGSFKFRGAYNALSQLGEEQRRKGVLTYSSGNHAAALALAGSLLGCPVTVVMPHDAPAVKKSATEGYGGEVVLYDRAEQSREELGRRLSEERGLTLIPPYDHPHIVAGAGTTALELLESCPDLDLVVVPCGGGGLMGGCSLTAKALRPGTQVFGVEPENGDDAARSLAAGSIQRVDNPQTIADGARTPSLSELTFGLARRHVDGIVTVSDEELVQATKFAWERLKCVVEPTGALGLAAVMFGKVPAAGKRTGVVVSGGNADVVALARLF